MSARVTWAKGGHALIVSIAADAIELRSTVPAPPGSRMEGTVAGQGAGEGAPMALRVKVHASRREGAEGQFLLQGRPLDLAREGRLRLEAMVREARKDREGAP